MSIVMSAQLCTAAGFDVRSMNPMDVYLLAGKILHDTELTEVSVSLHGSSQLPSGARTQVLKSWPASERAKLRERVSGVIQIRTN